jgi:hypothetical protein
MTDLSHLTGGPAHASRQVVLRARITKAPASETDSLHAIAINYTDVYDYEVPAGNWTPRGNALPAVGAECALVIDDDGDAWVPTWEGASAFPAAPDPHPPRVTSLPGSPVDGQECYFVADPANGILWHLRYNAGSASAYKWEVVGGSPLYAEVPAQESTASASFVALTTAGPSIALPLAGDYDVEQGALVVNQTSNGNQTMSYDIGGTAATDADGMFYQSNAQATNNLFAREMRARRKTGLSAVTLTSKYKSGNGTAIFQDRWMRVRPVRVG